MSWFLFPFSSCSISFSSQIVSTFVCPLSIIDLFGLAYPSIREWFSFLFSVRTSLASLILRLGAHYKKLPQLVGLVLLAFELSNRNMCYLSCFDPYEELVLMVQTSGCICEVRTRFCCTRSCFHHCIYPSLSSRSSPFLLTLLTCSKKL